MSGLHVIGTDVPDPDEQQRREALETLKQRKIVADNIVESLQKSIKPKGYYNIPDILDQRRLEYLIPNGAFECYPSFDKVFLYQIPMKEGETYKPGGMIIMPDQVISSKRNLAPRGILVSAGLKAMDALYSTGIEVGHIVRFKKFAPFILPVENVDGNELCVVVLRDGDIEASEDMSTRMNNRQISIQNISKTGYDFRVVDSQNNHTTGAKINEAYDASI